MSPEIWIPIVATVFIVVSFFVIMILLVLLALSLFGVVALFKRYDSIYKEYEQFISETSVYTKIETVEDAAEDLLEHCKTMRAAIDHNEEILFINFQNHIEHFLFKLGTVKQVSESKQE